MARYFLDSSALVKHYHQESGSAGVDALFDAPDSRLIISKLAIIEAQSSSARLVREGMLMPRDFGSLVSRLEGDVAAGILTVAAVSVGGSTRPRRFSKRTGSPPTFAHSMRST